jgi:hypothetical protein
MGPNGAAPSVFRWISGSMRVPHYMTKGAAPSATLVIDENNKPVYQVWSWAERAWGHRHTHQLNHGHVGVGTQGEVDVTFSVFIPRSCVVAGRAPCPIMNYGHGLLGTQGQVRSGRSLPARTPRWNRD